MSSLEFVRARALVALGAPTPGVRALAAFILVALALAAPAALAQPLSLDDAIRIGEARSAKVAAQSAAVNAAGEMAARAGELPDPKLVRHREPAGQRQDAWS